MLSAEGLSNEAIARQLKVTGTSVTYWQRRFSTDRLAGLQDLPKSGRPRTRGDDKIVSLLDKVLRQQPKAATH
jgi:transposase